MKVTRDYLSVEASRMLIEISRQKVSERKARKETREMIEAALKAQDKAKRDADAKAFADSLFAISRRYDQ